MSTLKRSKKAKQLKEYLQIERKREELRKKVLALYALWHK